MESEDEIKRGFEKDYFAGMAEAKAAGKKFFSAGVVRKWVERGSVTRSTAYLWARDCRDCGTIQDRQLPSEPVAAEVDAPDPGPEPAPFDGAAELSRAVEVLAPSRQGVQVVGFGLQLRELVRDTIDRSLQAIEHATVKETGKIRNAQFYHKSNETHGKLLVKLIELQDTYAIQGNINAFFGILLDEIAAESPATAMRIMDRLRRHMADWGLT
ncbi:MAG: hypothetical protein GC191_08995 [Azospirillum sp.]|nr:hypothetical protein [Azospirillum sp.]